MLVMPGQSIHIRMLDNIQGRFDLMPVKRVVVSAVLKFLPYASANFEPQSRRYCHVTCVKQTVNVPSEEKSVPRLVRPTIAIRTDMRGLQGRKRPLLSDHAAPLIDIGHEYPKSPLS